MEREASASQPTANANADANADATPGGTQQPHSSPRPSAAGTPAFAPSRSTSTRYLSPPRSAIIDSRNATMRTVSPAGFTPLSSSPASASTAPGSTVPLRTPSAEAEAYVRSRSGDNKSATSGGPPPPSTAALPDVGPAGDYATPLSHAPTTVSTVHTHASTPPSSSAYNSAPALHRRGKGGRSDRGGGDSELLGNTGSDSNTMSPNIAAGEDVEDEGGDEAEYVFAEMLQNSLAISLLLRRTVEQLQTSIRQHASNEEHAKLCRSLEMICAWVRHVHEELFLDFKDMPMVYFHQLTKRQKKEVEDDVFRGIEQIGIVEYLADFLPSNLTADRRLYDSPAPSTSGTAQEAGEAAAVRRLSLGHDERPALSYAASPESPSSSGTAKEAGDIPADATARIYAEVAAQLRAEMEGELKKAKDGKAKSDERGDRAEEAKKEAEEEATRAKEELARKGEELENRIAMMEQQKRKEIEEAEARGRAAAETGRGIGAGNGSNISSPTASRGRGVGSPFLTPTGIRLKLTLTPSNHRTSMSPRAKLLALLTPVRKEVSTNDFVLIFNNSIY